EPLVRDFSGLVIDHDDLVVFVLLKVSKPLLDQVGLPPRFFAGGIHKLASGLAADKIRELLHITPGVFGDLFEHALLFLVARRWNWDDYGLGWRRRRRREAAGSSCQLFERLHGLRTQALALQLFDRSIVQPLRELDFPHLGGDLSIGLLQLDRRAK